MFFILARFASIFVYDDIYISFQYAILCAFAAVFGPVCGLLIGLIGHVLTDISFYSSFENIWWSWVIASALVGFLAGFVIKAGKVEKGEFDKRDILRFIIGNLVIHAISWVAVAPILDIVLYNEPMEKLFMQGLIAGTSNFVITAIVGSLLLAVYAKSQDTVM